MLCALERPPKLWATTSREVEDINGQISSNAGNLFPPQSGHDSKWWLWALKTTGGRWHSVPTIDLSRLPLPLDFILKTPVMAQHPLSIPCLVMGQEAGRWQVPPGTPRQQFLFCRGWRMELRTSQTSAGPAGTATAPREEGERTP